MRYTISPQQLSAFRRERCLELEGLFSPVDVEIIKTLLDESITKTASGRDLERESPPLKKALHLTRIGQVAAGLFLKPRLRLAFTQYQPPFEMATFESISSVTELPGGCILNLESGNVTFYPADEWIDFHKFEDPILVIGICHENGRYKLQEHDPHTHMLKRLGYVFGDKLNETTHPFIAK